MPTFNYLPDHGAEAAIRPRVMVAPYGDGYEQRVVDGINSKPRTWRLSFANRPKAEATEIEAFLNARGGAESFDWTPPHGEVGKWLCREWSISATAPGIYSVSAEFVEIFGA